MSDFQAQYLAMIANTPYLQSVARAGKTIIGVENYTYEVTVGVVGTGLPIGGGAVSTLVTQGDSDFVLEGLAACVNLTPNGNMLFNRNVALQIQDLTSGKFFFSQATAFALVAGSAGSPFMFAAPRVLAPNSALAVSANNVETVGGSTYNQMFVSFLGTKIFYAS